MYADVVVRPLFGVGVGRNTDDVSDENEKSLDEQSLLFLARLPLSAEEVDELLGNDGKKGSLVGEEPLVGLKVRRDLEEVHAKFFVFRRLVVEA